MFTGMIIGGIAAVGSGPGGSDALVAGVASQVGWLLAGVGIIGVTAILAGLGLGRPFAQLLAVFTNTVVVAAVAAFVTPIGFAADGVGGSDLNTLITVVTVSENAAALAVLFTSAVTAFLAVPTAAAAFIGALVFEAVIDIKTLAAAVAFADRLIGNTPVGAVGIWTINSAKPALMLIAVFIKDNLAGADFSGIGTFLIGITPIKAFGRVEFPTTLTVSKGIGLANWTGGPRVLRLSRFQSLNSVGGVDSGSAQEESYHKDKNRNQISFFGGFKLKSDLFGVGHNGR